MDKINESIQEKQNEKNTINYNSKITNIKSQIENQNVKLEEYKKIYDEAIKNDENKKAEIYGKLIDDANKRKDELENICAYMREDNSEDLVERNDALNQFSKEIAENIPEDIPMVFHGNNDISKVYEILKSGGLKTPDERGEDFKSFATQIDVANKYDAHVPVKFAEPGIKSARPYGAIFAFCPKENERYKGLKDFGSEVPGGVESIDFKEEDNRFFGVITTKENKERIQKWLQEFKMDSNKVYTHDEFIEMCKDKLKNKERISGQELGKQVIQEMSDSKLEDDTEKETKKQRTKELEKSDETKEN